MGTSLARSVEPAGEVPEAPLILTRDLRRDYDAGGEVVQALRGIDLSIDRNQFVAIMGPSGSGKSTLLGLLGCLDAPSGGEYRLNGRAVSELKEEELARVRNQEIGFVFQAFHLLPRATAQENVELPLAYSRVGRGQRLIRAREALEEVGLGHRASHRPSELSGGERQRVAIARALVTRPSIVLADEPTGNLDSVTGGEIMQLFLDLHRAGQTIILVTHETHVAQHTNRQLHLMDGSLVRDTETEQLS